MAANTKSTTIPVTYASPCGRVRVERHEARDFWTFVDERFIGARTSSTEAEHVGHELLFDLLLDDDCAQRDDQAAADEARYAGYSWTVTV